MEFDSAWRFSPQSSISSLHLDHAMIIDTSGKNRHQTLNLRRKRLYLMKCLYGDKQALHFTIVPTWSVNWPLYAFIKTKKMVFATLCTSFRFIILFCLAVKREAEDNIFSKRGNVLPCNVKYIPFRFVLFATAVVS